jgi:hypothetical protein
MPNKIPERRVEVTINEDLKPVLNIYTGSTRAMGWVFKDIGAVVDFGAMISKAALAAFSIYVAGLVGGLFGDDPDE